LIIKKLIFLSFLLLLFVGCTKTVSYNISEDFTRIGPVSVVVMPVMMMASPDEGETKELKLVRTTVQEKLKEKNYSTVPINEVNSKLISKGLFKGEKLPAPQLVAPVFKSDAILYTHITEWDKSKIASYVALKIGIEFHLYSANGKLLWEGSFSTKESDIRMDSSATELGVLKAYEPRVQRLVDTIFLTMPPARRRTKTEDFFKWLP